MSGSVPDKERSIFTIGHSNHSLDNLLELLKTHRVQVLVDTRSHPRSRFAPYFNKDSLRSAVISERMRYLFLGKELGGRPEGSEFYDATGRVDYARVAESSIFLEGIARLEKGLNHYCVALLCSEENPRGCHRRLLVGRVLAARGVTVKHIRGNGSIQTENAEKPVDHQPLLFETQRETEWKSIQPVLRRKQLPNSSTH